MKKIALSFTFFCFSFLVSSAQQFSMKWSEDLDKFSSGTFSIMQPVKSIDVGDGSIISLFAKVQTTNTKFFLVKGSNLPDISSTLDLDEASIDGIFLNLIKIGANCYIVKYKNYSQNSTSLFLQKINTKTLQLEKEAKDIINYDGQQTANKSQAEVKICCMG